MTIDRGLQTRLQVAFKPLNNRRAQYAFPPAASLSTALEQVMPPKANPAVTVRPEVASLYATAAVDIWLRAVHSFLISAALTEASPLWASSVGYYSSHYAVRAIAHLLGCFHLHRRRRIVRLGLQCGKHVCTFGTKNAGDREHCLYWREVKSDSHFATDPLFTRNEKAQQPDDCSNVGHRDRANYVDHLFPYPAFRVLDVESLKIRVQRISEIDFTVPPIPKPNKFPDLDNVQVVAYHRIVRFRKFLDEILVQSSRFWNVHRNPTWVSGIVDFQITEHGGLEVLKN